jgi:hypothetical protein
MTTCLEYEGWEFGRLVVVRFCSVYTHNRELETYISRICCCDAEAMGGVEDYVASCFLRKFIP